MNANYNQRDWAWKPTKEIIAALDKGDKALKNFYDKKGNKEYEDSTHIEQTLAWEAKLESFSEVVR